MSKKVTSFRTRRGVGDGALMETLDAFARPALRVLGEEPSVIDAEARKEIAAKAELLGALRARRASAWRNLGPRLRVNYYQLALMNGDAWVPAHATSPSPLTVAAVRATPLYEATAFTLNLAPQVQGRALRWARGPADYFRRLMTRRLPTTPFYFACEFDEDRLHLHGGLGFPPRHEERVRGALKAIGGPYPLDFEERALRFVSIYDPVVWANYTAQELRDTARRLGSTPLATTRLVGREARRLHGMHRTLLLGENVSAAA